MDRHQEVVQLTSEDRYRMSRLYEEIQSRLHEMGNITARVLSVPAEGIAGVKLDMAGQAPLDSGDARRIRAIQMKGIEFIYKDGKCVGIYDHDAGTCSAC